MSERRGAWLEIDLAATRHNLHVIRQLVAGSMVAPVVKADAYGHGMVAVARAIAGDADALCVATLDEAIELRAHVDGRILLLYPVPPEAVPEAVTLALELPVLAPSDLEHIRRAASLKPANLPPVRLHLGVETGMGRGGLPLAAAAAAAAEIEAHPALELAGIWSHLHSPGEAEASALQRLRLEEAAAAVAAAGIAVPPRHLAATGGIFAGGGLALDLVRPGIALHGLVDDDIRLTGTAAEAARRLRPTMAIKARALAFSDVPIGGTVGYGGTWRAERPSRVAVLPVGYGDGYLRASQPGAAALVLGRRVPLVGRVSMDAVTADVTDLPGVDSGDEFVLLGAQGPERIDAGELARRRNTIAREVLAAMAPRLTRVYHPVAETPGIGNDASGG